MIYPSFLKKGDIIGLTAPSDGRTSEPDKRRLDFAVSAFKERGYRVIETASTRQSEKGRSADGRTRANELAELVNNPETGAVIAVSGGDLLFEMLPYVDYELFKKHPVWFEGMSDPTGLTYTITTLADVASIYGCNAGDFGMSPWDKGLDDNLKILEGKTVVQHERKSFQSGWLDVVNGDEPFVFDSDVKLYTLNGEKEINMSGRLLGGCFDVLVGLCGTEFDRTAEFVKKYADDGILWYLEVFSMTPELLSFYLWKLKHAGWFENAAGFMFGRPCMLNTEYSLLTYEEAIKNVIPEGVPVILDMDFGHRPPRMTIVNGAIGHVKYSDGTCEFKQEFR